MAPPGRGPITARRALIGGLLLAALGVPFLFGPGLTTELIGIGLICLGAGIALTVVVRGALIEGIAAARRSRASAAGMVFVAPHLVVFGAIGLGLIALGVLMLAAAFGGL